MPQQNDFDVEIRKVTWAGLIINLVLSAVKFIAGMVSQSQAVVADAVHSISDCSTDIAVLIGSRYWSRPPDAEHPYGHRRIETMVTILIGLALVAVSLGLAWQALFSIHEHSHRTTGVLASMAAFLSILVKEWLYWWTVQVGKEARSSAVMANAWHHRSDALSSIPAFLASGASWLFAGWNFIDHVGAVVVSIFIFYAACKIAWPSLQELLEAGAPQDVVEQIRSIALREKEILYIHAIRTRYLASGLMVEMHIVVPGSMTVWDSHEAGERVRRAILNEMQDTIDVIIHVDPLEAVKSI